MKKCIITTYTHTASVSYPPIYLSILSTSQEAMRSHNNLCIFTRTRFCYTGGIIPKYLSYALLSRRLEHLSRTYSHLHPDDMCTF